MIKYIEPSNLIEDSNLNATAVGVYVTLLHCSSDGKHCKNISKKELQELLHMTDKTLKKYLDDLSNNGYLSITKGYDSYFNITLKADDYNYVDYYSNGGVRYEVIDDPENYTVQEFFGELFHRKLTSNALKTIQEADLNPILVNYAIGGSFYHMDRFIDYDYLINYVLRTVKDWEHKHITSIDEVKRYMDAHRKGYRFFSDIEIKRLKDNYGIDRSPQNKYDGSDW